MKALRNCSKSQSTQETSEQDSNKTRNKVTLVPRFVVLTFFFNGALLLVFGSSTLWFLLPYTQRACQGPDVPSVQHRNKISATSKIYRCNIEKYEKKLIKSYRKILPQHGHHVSCNIYHETCGNNSCNIKNQLLKDMLQRSICLPTSVPWHFRIHNILHVGCTSHIGATVPF